LSTKRTTPHQPRSEQKKWENGKEREKETQSEKKSEKFKQQFVDSFNSVLAFPNRQETTPGVTKRDNFHG
jgi:hypothetical protein